MSGCLKREEIFRYSKEKIPKKEEKKIKNHLYGDKIGTGFDKELGVTIILYNYKGCPDCLKILTEINKSSNAML